MTDWTPQELDQLDRAYEVRAAGRRADGSSRSLTIVWHVVVDGALYLRSVKGPEASGTAAMHATSRGFLSWDGTTRAVTHTETEPCDGTSLLRHSRSAHQQLARR